jgi:hypothetical protein
VKEEIAANALLRRGGGGVYLIAVETVESVVFSLVPRPVITGMTATAIPVAINPYSMAVAALSSFQNLTMRRTHDAPCRSIHPYD